MKKFIKEKLNDLKYWWLDWYPLFGIALGVIVFMVGITMLANSMTREACKAKAEQIGVEHSYDFYKGCFIKEDGRWVDYEKTRSVR